MSAGPDGDATPRTDVSLGGQLMASSLERALFGAEETHVRLGRFVVIDRIASGGMGVVYRAFDPDLGRPLAIKVLVSGREHLGARMRREAQILARLNHPHIVTVYEIGVHEGRLYVAMELVAGGTLQDWCARNPPSARARFTRLLGLAIQAARGLAAAHEAGLVHRDLKPGNLLVDGDDRLRIADFGLARTSDSVADERLTSTVGGNATEPSGPLTSTGDVLGTPAYMPPEQFAGTSDARSDQWSLCATFWEAAYGERAFPATAAIEAVPRRPARRADVPGWFAEVLTRGLASDPASRYADVRALLDDIERRRDRRRRIALGSGAAALAGLLTWAAVPREAAAPCAATQAGLDGVWTAEVAASQASERIAGRLDAYAARWRLGAAGVCENAVASGELEPGSDPLELPSRAMACFRDARVQLQAVLDVVAAAESSEHALLLVQALPNLSRCESAADGPADDVDGGRAAVEALARASVAQRTSDFASARAHLDEANTVLADLDRPGLLARASLVEASIESHLDDDEAHLAATKRALAWAEAAGDPAEIAHAWMFVIDAAGTSKQFDVADLAVERATSMTRVAGDPPWLLASLFGSRGRLAYRRGDYAEAYEVGKRELEQMDEDEDAFAFAKRTRNLSQFAVLAGDPAGALELASKSVALHERALAADHPETARARLWLGQLHSIAGDYAQAEPLLREALEVIGDDDNVARSDRLSAYIVHATLLRNMRRFPEAREAVAGGLRLGADLPADDVFVLVLRATSASIDLEVGNYSAAITELEDVRRRMPPPTVSNSAENRIAICGDLALAYARDGRNSEASAVVDACHDELDALGSDIAGLRGSALRYFGEVYRRVGRREDARTAYAGAIEHLERLGTDAVESAEARLGHAELLLDEGDLAKARSELELATAAAASAPAELHTRIEAAKRRADAGG